MACVVCEHCQSPVSRHEGYTVREGYSYHDRCHKCYVCSETNLLDAEVFKGVIFCASCSQRIFQGCATARRTKDIVTPRRTNSRSRRRRDRVRPQDRRLERASSRNGVIEMARLGRSSNSDSRSWSDDMKKYSKTLALTTELQTGKVYEDNTKSMKKDSAEIGMTTDVTQELLRQMNCPVVVECKDKPASPPKHKKHYKGDNFNSNLICSDLRIAELGASTEIANMALRKTSELPVIIKSESRLKRADSLTLSILNQESDISGDVNEEWIDSAYSSLQDSVATSWMDRRIGSVLKLPYRYFKRNILKRSSAISALISSEHDKIKIIKQLKLLFDEEITEHQRRGIKRLYSTINREKAPYKLGWLQLMANVSGVLRPLNNHKGCKHFRTSHSYRCIRAQAMRLAGPTKSELAVFRTKVKNIIAPSFLRNIISNKGHAAIMMTQACGNDSLGGSDQLSSNVNKKKQ